VTDHPTSSGASESRLGWHVICGEDLLAMLRRVAEGEDPDLVYIEEYVNAEVERVDGDS
jgi:hypothetical protein